MFAILALYENEVAMATSQGALYAFVVLFMKS